MCSKKLRFFFFTEVTIVIQNIKYFWLYKVFSCVVMWQSKSFGAIVFFATYKIKNFFFFLDWMKTFLLILRNEHIRSIELHSTIPWVLAFFFRRNFFICNLRREFERTIFFMDLKKICYYTTCKCFVIFLNILWVGFTLEITWHIKHNKGSKNQH